jgi:hypothetical protein
MVEVGLEQDFLLLHIAPLVHTHLLPVPEVCDSHDQAEH